MKPSGRVDCVTGAFGFTGRFIAARLREGGIAVRTLTNHPNSASALANEIDARPYAFDRSEQLAKDLEGVHTLYNTYWVRFERGRLATNAPSGTRGACSRPRARRA